MNTEFHYHINLIIAQLAGFSERLAQTIAHSAQFVDDNSKVRRVMLEGAIYENIITQTLNLKLPEAQLKEIYTCFHFQPGNEIGITIAASKLARQIFTEAIESGNPYMIGIASHAFADTYAHQNFIGHSHPHNNPVGLEGVPSYGHMYYLELPDLVGVKWFDMRTGKINDNNKRFIQAAIELLRYYCKHNGVSTRETLKRQSMLKKLLIPTFAQSPPMRMRQYSAIYRELGGTTIPPYGPQRWQRQAMYYSSKNETWMATHNFENSHWYNFQEQAKSYRALALKRFIYQR